MKAIETGTPINLPGGVTVTEADPVFPGLVAYQPPKLTNHDLVEALGVASPARLTEEQLEVRIRRSFELKSIRCATELKNLWNGETLCIVGSGTSKADTMPELLELIAAGAKVMAVNKALGWLMDRGIVPTFAILSDPKDFVVDYQEPTPGVKHLICSTCDDAVFAKFRGHPETFLWHAWSFDAHADVLIEEARKHNKSFFATVGGSTTTMRGWDMAVLLLGFREIRFFGVDSSSDERGEMYLYDKPQLDPVGLHFRLNDPVEDVPLERIYHTTQPMFHQARQFELLLASRRDGIRAGKYPPVRIAVHGSGLLPDWAALRGLHADPNRGDELRKTRMGPTRAEKEAELNAIYDRMGLDPETRKTLLEAALGEKR